MASQALEAEAIVLNDLPTVLVVDSNTEALGHCSAILKTLGYNHHTVASAEEGLDRISRDPTIQIVLADRSTPVLDGVTMIEEMRARLGSSRAIAPILMTDQLTTDIALRCLHIEAADVLCKPLEFERLSVALRRAMQSVRSRQQLLESANLSSFGAQLKRLFSSLEHRSLDDPSEEGPSDAEVAAALRTIISARAMRGRHFSTQLFADPAWDILLDLTRARLANQDVSVSSVCIAASVPMSTALRWVCQMVDIGLLHRWRDPKDRRRDLIALTEPTAAHMRNYLAAVHALMRKV